MPKQAAQQEGISVRPGLEVLGSSLPWVERTPEVICNTEGAQRAGMVVVEPATVIVELAVTVVVGAGAVTVAAVTV